jgi:hypothetical protein
VPEKRRLRNNQVRHQANLRIKQAAMRFDGDGHVFEFLCECDRSDCTEMLRLSLAQYATLGGDHRYLVVREHVDDARRLAAMSEGIYAIVREDEPGR